MTAVRPVLRQLAIVVALVMTMPVFVVSPAEAADRRHHTEIRDRIEYKINRQRVRHGVRKLRVNTKTQRTAREHARRMARSRRIFHDPNLRRGVPAAACAWGENVVRTRARNAVRSSMRMFMNSSAHRSNILRKRWTHMGIGVAKRGKYTYIVQRFIDRRC